MLGFFVEVPEGVEFLQFDNIFADDEGLFFGVGVGVLSVGFAELGFVHVCLGEDVSGWGGL